MQKPVTGKGMAAVGPTAAAVGIGKQAGSEPIDLTTLTARHQEERTAAEPVLNQYKEIRAEIKTCNQALGKISVRVGKEDQAGDTTAVKQIRARIRFLTSQLSELSKKQPVAMQLLIEELVEKLGTVNTHPQAYEVLTETAYFQLIGRGHGRFRTLREAAKEAGKTLPFVLYVRDGGTFEDKKSGERKLSTEVFFLPASGRLDDETRAPAELFRALHAAKNRVLETEAVAQAQAAPEKSA